MYSRVWIRSEDGGWWEDGAEEQDTLMMKSRRDSHRERMENILRAMRRMRLAKFGTNNVQEERSDIRYFDKRV